MNTDNALVLNPALLSQAKTAPTASKGMNMTQIDAAAKEFESMFLTEMLRPMFDSVGVDENFGGGKGEEIFRSFMLDEYGKNLSQNGGLGIAALVKEQLIAMQGKPPPAAPAPDMAQNMHGIIPEIQSRGDSDV